MPIKLISLTRRYTDKRSIYIPPLINEIIDRAIVMGIKVPKDSVPEDPMYTTNEMFSKWKSGRFEKE